MKMFSDCSGECCVCVCGDGGCLAGHGDDDYAPASKEQIIERLVNGRYKDHTEYMKNYLKTYHNYDYDKERASTEQTKTAHWIIECHGFGGSTYMCSECGAAWNDNYTDVSMEDKCPSCGAQINDDDNEYVERKKSKISDGTDIKPNQTITPEHCNHNWKYESTSYYPKDMCYVKQYVCTKCGEMKTEEENSVNL